MKVVGAGFGRTGTTSLKAALETLGFGSAYHMTEVFEHPEHVGFWEAAGRGEPVDWEEFFSGYGVAVDWPACAFYGELMEAFPGAAVILTVRDPGRWYESVLSTIYGIHRISSGPAPIRTAFAIAGLFAPGVTGIARLADEIVWKGTFDGRFEDETYAIETFQRHNERVLRSVPPERLLVYDVKEGWAPLCDFFGLDIPDEPFPHLNDAREMRLRLLGLVAASAATPVVVVAGVVAALAYLLRRARYGRG
ncbi:sulfotransferase family protein [Rubrobacter tropicus]|uniref:sulfotransferase family protein n=1 Tax=Rubrobacter tropicus TaxID=2653851 RepID=UPI00140ADE6A|nr:sulfotransferase family protein [Rubrobacter tropicus]